jgi:hypothetical protein
MNRQMRRMQKHGGPKGSNGAALAVSSLTDLLKTLPAFEQVAEAAKGVEPLVDKLKDVQGLVAELMQLRDDLKGMAAREAAREDEYKIELERQRAVFLRFLFSPNILMSSSGQANLEKFLAAEQRYRNEYDAMVVLVKLLTWAKEAP